MATRVGNQVRAIAAVAALAQGVAANAAIMTETETFSLTAPQATFQVMNNSTDEPVVTDTNSGPQSAIPALLNFNQFNPALGTLLGVTVSFLSTYSSTATLLVNSGPFDNGTVGTTDFFADGTFDFLLSATGLITDQPSTKKFSAMCAITYTDVDVNQAKTCDDTATNPGNFNGSTSGLSLDPFRGTSTFNLNVALTSALLPRVNPDNKTGVTEFFADNSTFSGTLNDGWSGSVSVVYTFDTPTGGVPEPLTLYLVLAALGAIALVPRRRI